MFLLDAYYVYVGKMALRIVIFDLIKMVCFEDDRLVKGKRFTTMELFIKCKIHTLPLLVFCGIRTSVSNTDAHPTVQNLYSKFDYKTVLMWDILCNFYFTYLF